MSQHGLIRDDYAGPGGWSRACELLGLQDVGIEWDADACSTRAAAGYLTIRADLATYRCDQHLWGYIASPPCQSFSVAGSGDGRALVQQLVKVVHDADWDQAEQLDPRTRHVIDVARNCDELDTDWICLEQVPPVLPIWKAIAHRLRARGYSVWCGVLNAADYGVPQTRKRAILIASRTRTVSAPVPTHAKNPVPDLFGPALEQWISMAEALGWNGWIDRRQQHDGDPVRLVPTSEPAPTVVVQSHCAWQRVTRVVVEVEHDTTETPVEISRHRPLTVATGQQTSRHDRDPDHAELYERGTDLPAPTVTGSADQWTVGAPGHRVQLNPGLSDSQPRRRRYDMDEPAPTLAFDHDAASWCWENPAPTLTGGGGSGGGGVEPFANAEQRKKIRASWPAENPAPTVTGGRGGAAVGGSRIRGKMADGWPYERPATTIAGDARCWPPGHKVNQDDRDRLGDEEAALRYGDRAGTDAVRLEVTEALLLQSFPADHPVSGTRSAQFQQVGNAIPPLLARAIICEATGLTI